MNERNKKYYKHAYDKVYASDELKERMINMKRRNVKENSIRPAEEKNSRKSYHRIWKAAVVAAAFTVIVSSGVYAATHYWGIGDFFTKINHTLTKEAGDLIEKDVAVQTKDKKSGQEMPVELKVKETLCDSDSVHIVLEAQAKEKGKYLLVPENSKKSDSVSGLGMKEETTIGEYADNKGLKLLYMNYGFDDSSEFSPLSYTSDYVLVNDDTMNIYISARKEGGNKNLNVAVECSARGTSDVKGTLYSILNFKLQDRSSGKKVSYTSDEKMAVKGTKAVVTKVTMERTEVSTYVKVYYNYPDNDLESGLFFRIRDEKGTLWECSDGLGDESLGGEKYCCTLTYDSSEFPEKCILEAFNCWETNDIYGQFILSKD